MKLLCKLLGLLGIKKCSRCEDCPKKACHAECKAISADLKAKAKSKRPLKKKK